MTVATYRPVSVLDQFHREVEQLFGQQRPVAGWTPTVEIREFDNRFELRADVPGVAVDDIDITVENNVLTVSGERVAPAEDGQVHRAERRYGEFSRQFRLPETVDVEGVKASGENGVLEITLPKAQTLQARKITVQAG